MKSVTNEKISEYERRLLDIKTKNEELKLSIIKLKQEKDRLTEHLHSLEDEYTLMMNRLEIEEQASKNKNKSNLLTNSNPAREAEETNFVLNEFDQILKAALYKRHEYMEKEQQIQEIAPYNLLCSCVLVIFITSEDIVRNTYKILCQTFKIDSNTTFRILRNAILNFWNPSQVEDYDYKMKLYTCDNTLKNIDDESEKIDSFLKQISNNSFARFVFYLDSEHLDNLEMRIKGFIKMNERCWNSNIDDEEAKNKDEEDKEDNESIDEESHEESNEKDFLLKGTSVDVELDRFIKEKFVGLTEYAIEKFKRLKNKGNEVKKPQKKKIVLKYVFKVLSLLNGLAFAIILIFSLTYKTTPQYLYSNRKSLESIFVTENEKEQYLTKSNFIDSVMKIVAPLFRTNSPTDFYSSIAVVSPMQTIFYRVKEGDTCNKEVLSKFKITCYNPHYYYFKREKKDLTSWDTSTYISSVFTSPIDYTKYYIESSLTANQNYIQGIQNIEDYYTNVFKSFPKSKDDVQLYTLGEIGTYYGQGYIFEVSPQLISSDVYRKALEITKEDSILYDEGLRAIEINFSFYHYPSNFFYYVTLLYEANIDGSIKGPFFEINPFKTNFFLGKTGISWLIVDVISLICIALMIMEVIFTIVKTKNKHKKKNKHNFLDYLKFTFIAFSLILHIVSFGIQMKKFYFPKCTFGAPANNSLGIPEIKNDTNFYVYWFLYDLVNLFECWSLVLYIIHFSTIIFNTKKVQIITNYISNAFIEAFGFYILFFLIIFILSIIGHTLYGNDIRDFNEIMTSFTWVLLILIGHYNEEFNKFADKPYTFIYMIILVFVLRFIYNAMVIVNYFDIFRRICLRRGYIWERREIEYEKEREKRNFKKNDEEKKQTEKKIEDEEEYEEIEIEEEIEEEVEVEEDVEPKEKEIEIQTINNK